jgi:hypothetical protein
MKASETKEHKQFLQGEKKKDKELATERKRNTKLTKKSKRIVSPIIH